MQQSSWSSLVENASGCIDESINCFSETELILHCLCLKLIFRMKSNLLLQKIILARSFLDAHFNILNRTQIRAVYLVVIRERVPWQCQEEVNGFPWWSHFMTVLKP